MEAEQKTENIPNLILLQRYKVLSEDYHLIFQATQRVTFSR